MIKRDSNMLNVVIVSAGLGTRLKPLTNYVPKCLLPYKGKALLLHQYEIYAKSDIKMWLIVNRKHKPLVARFCQIHNLQIKLLIHNEADGTANAIAKTCSHLAGQSVGFQWADLLIEKADWLEHAGNTVCLTRQEGNRYKYDALTRQITYASDYSGDIIGAYFLKKYEPIEEQIHGTDFADLPFKYDGIRPKYKDLGDIDKWLNKYQLPTVALQLSANQWQKYYDDADQCQNEFNWYVANKPGFVLDKRATVIVMQSAKGKQLCEKPDAYKALIASVRSKSQFVRIEPAGTTYLNETYFKFNERLARSSIYNSSLILQALFLLMTAISIINKNSHCIIANGHFDLNCLNVFVQNKTKFEFIDPRAQFDGKCQGPLEYEISKIYYGLMIWSALCKLNELELLASEPTQLCIVPIAELKAGMTDIERAWCVIHLLTAFGRFNKNPLREFIAFSYGIKLAKYILA